MATQVMFQEHHDTLTGLVRRWDRRLRLSQTVLWLPRSLLPGLALGIVIAVISRMRPWLMPQQIALVAGALVAIGVVVFALAVWFWRRPPLTSARRFDLEFHLNERVSTALELMSGTIHANEELALRQLEDARARASEVSANEHIPLTVSRRDWVIALVLAAVLTLFLLLPNPQADVLAAASEQQTAIDNAAEQVREAMQDVASDTSLGNEDRKTLLEQLQTNLNTLEQPNISPEEAFAAMSDAQSALRDSSDELNQQSSLNQSALQQAADALRQAGQQSSSQANNSQPSGAMEQVTQDLDQIAQNASEMTEAERQQAAEALRNAAQSLQSSNPQAAQNLNDAARQMQQPNLNQQQLQQALDQAQQQMQQQSQQSQQQQESAQNLNNSAQQMQQSTSQISQSQQQQGQQNQQGQQSQQNQQDQQSQQQQGQQNQQGQQSQQQQQGQQNQQGQQSQQQGDQGEPGSQQGQQQGDPNAAPAQSEQSIPGEGQQQDQQASSSQQTTSLSAGDQPGDQQGNDQGSAQRQSSNLNQPDNNADGQGEGEFESVNIPRRIGPQGNDGNNVQLDPDASNAPVQEGDFSENPTGQVTVPYNQVFSNYADAANRALDSDYVPLGLRDVVHDYFTSLEPRP